MITGIVRFSYVALTEPKPDLQGTLKYSVCLLIPKSDTKTVADVKAQIKKAVEDGVRKGKFTAIQANSNKFKNCLRDGDGELASGDREGKEYSDHFFINASNKVRPGGVDKQGHKFMDPQNEVYSGMYGRADIAFFPFNQGGGMGIGCAINNFMKERDGERLDNRVAAEDAFKDFVENESELK